MIPPEIIEATRIESKDQGFESLLPKPEGSYLFSYMFSDEKYGKTREDRIRFWKEVLANQNYTLFFEKFPKSEEHIINGEKFII